MRSRKFASIIPLSILLLTIEKNDGLPRNPSSSPRNAVNQTAEQTSVQKLSPKFPSTSSGYSHFAQPTWRSNFSKHEVKQTKIPFNIGGFELAQPPSVETSASKSTPNDFVPHHPRNEDKKLRKTFAQVLMTGTSRSDDHHSEETVQKEGSTSQRSPQADGQASDKSDPEFIGQGPTSNSLPLSDSDGFSSGGREEELETELLDSTTNNLQPIKSESNGEYKEIDALREKMSTDEEKVRENYRSGPTDLNKNSITISTPEPVEAEQKSEKGVVEKSQTIQTTRFRITDPLTEQVGIIDKIEKQKVDKKAVEETIHAGPGTPRTLGHGNIRFGSIDIADFENRSEKFKIRTNYQPEKKLDHSVRTHPEQAAEEESTFGNIRSLGRNDTIDSDVFEIDLNKERVTMPSEYNTTENDDFRTSSPTDNSAIFDPSSTRICNSEEETNELSRKIFTNTESSENEMGETFDEVDQYDETAVEGTEVEQLTGKERCRSLRDKKSFLVVPADHSKNVHIYSEFGAMNININNVGTSYRKFFRQSGALLLRFWREEDAVNLCNVIVASKNLKVVSKVHVVRVYNIPAETTSEELWYVMYLEYEEKPENIEIRIRKCYDGNQTYYERTAVMMVTKTLWWKIRNSPTIHIRWQPYDIDTYAHVPRCYRCHLIGHMVRDCNVPPRHARPPPASWPYRCVDCSHHNANILSKKRSERRRRDVNHPTNADFCPTKIAYRAGKL